MPALIVIRKLHDKYHVTNTNAEYELAPSIQIFFGGLRSVHRL
jgi:hypothetical protein